MAIPKIYRKSPVVLVPNTDYYDIATQRSYKILKAAAGKPFGLDTQHTEGGSGISGAVYYLNPNNTYSDPLLTSSGIQGAGLIMRLSLAFDLPIEATIIVDGDGILTMPCGFRKAAGGTGTHFASYALVVVPTSGASTTLVSASSAIVSSTLGTSTIVHTKTFKDPISRKVIKKGTTLRLITDLWSDVNSALNLIAHDPENRANSLFATTLWPASTDSVLQYHLPLVNK